MNQLRPVFIAPVGATVPEDLGLTNIADQDASIFVKLAAADVVTEKSVVHMTLREASLLLQILDYIDFMPIILLNLPKYDYDRGWYGLQGGFEVVSYDVLESWVATYLDRFDNDGEVLVRFGNEHDVARAARPPAGTVDRRPTSRSDKTKHVVRRADEEFSNVADEEEGDPE